MTSLQTLPSKTSATGDTGWAALEAELDIWQSAGRTASFWWRDDDAITWTRALDRLLAVAEDAPIALAVIPAHADARLADGLARAPAVTVLQHGWRHTNHAPPGERKSEFGAHRALAQRLDQIRHGRERLQSLFGPRALGVLVPPWNRIALDLAPHLPEAGIHGLSVAGARRAEVLVVGVRAVNVHADLVDWKGSRGFVGETSALGLILFHLRSRFLGTADPDEPTGILTHHLLQDAPTEGFLRQLISTVQRHPAARFVPIPQIFPAP
ncbi:MAG: polysaccharide deacetylase family protein [Stellaceae bacterium]